MHTIVLWDCITGNYSCHCDWLSAKKGKELLAVGGGSPAHSPNCRRKGSLGTGI